MKISVAVSSVDSELREVELPLGKMLYWYRTRYGHGFRVAYYRDVVRPRILRTAPIDHLDDARCEIHVLTSQHDWLNLIWVLKSFYHCSGRRYQLCIHEDGTLTSRQLEILNTHFPGARVIDRAQADRRANIQLANSPRSQAFRATNPLALKVFDFAMFLESSRMLLLDSDILFFEIPAELLRRLEDSAYRKNTLNKDWGYGYSIDPQTSAPYLDFSLCLRVNSGLGLIHRDSIELPLLEQWLGLQGILSHSHRIEQTLIALYSSRYGFEFLPEEYDVHLGDQGPSEVCRHYTGPIRHLMYSRGMRRLWRECRWTRSK